MKTLIIPDIHNKFAIAEDIIALEKPDQTIFLGDYFDSYDESVETYAKQTAHWLKLSLKDKSRTHLFGNHDLFYVNINREFACSGNTVRKAMIIQQASIDWTKLRLHVWLDNWLLTHAGLTKAFYALYKHDKDTVRTFIDTQAVEALENLHDGHWHRLFSVSAYRGGINPYAGIVWCDVNEFEDIEGIRQLFGHTRDDTVRISLPPLQLNASPTGHACIDCGLNVYAVYEDKYMTFKDVVPT